MSPWHTSIKGCTTGQFLYRENTVIPGLSSFFIITGWKSPLFSGEEKDNWDVHNYLEVLRNVMRHLISKYAHCGIVLTQEVPLQFKQHFIRPLNTKEKLYIRLELSRSAWLSIISHLPLFQEPGSMGPWFSKQSRSTLATRKQKPGSLHNTTVPTHFSKEKASCSRRALVWIRFIYYPMLFCAFLSLKGSRPLFLHPERVPIPSKNAERDQLRLAQ